MLCINKIQDYTKDLEQISFNENELIQDAVIRNIEIIGEATKKISSDLKSQYREIPWKEMSGMRDKLIHDYFGVVRPLWGRRFVAVISATNLRTPEESNE